LRRSLRIALIAGSLGLVLAAVAIGWVLPSWLYPRDFHAVRGDLARVMWRDAEESAAGRLVSFDAWSQTGLHVTGILRLPPNAETLRPRYVSLILGGHRTGAKAAPLIHLPPDHAVAAIDYPYRGATKWRLPGDVVIHGPAVLRAIRTTGPALSLAAAALARHPALRESEVILIGASLGAPFAAQAAAADSSFSALVLLYGFADFEHMFERALSRLEWPPLLRQGGARLASHLVQDFEPVNHLRRLESMPVLLVNDVEDHLVPRQCVEALHRAAPPGATSRLIKSGHVRPKNEQLIADLTELVFAWSDTLGQAGLSSAP
jgi:hypothetical protein